MRILLIGSDNEWRMERAVERAFRRAGHVTRLIDDRRMKRLLGQGLTQRWAVYESKRFDPEFVFLSKCLALDVETVSTILAGTPNVMWYHDPQWHADLDRPDIAHIARIGRLAQTFFVTGFDAEWRANGLPAVFLPAAGDAAIVPVPAVAAYGSDVAFIGSGYDSSRAEFLARVATHHELRVWGPGWEQWRSTINWSGRKAEGREFAAVCSSSCITLGINPARALGGMAYTSDRTWMVMLAGGFYLTQRTAGIAAMLREGEHCAFYDDAESCIEQCGRYLDTSEERERVRAGGELFVREHHTYDSRIENLLEQKPFENPLRDP